MFEVESGLLAAADSAGSASFMRASCPGCGSVLLYPVVAFFAATGAVAVDMPAAATPSKPGEVYTLDGWCHYTNWEGSFYCDRGTFTNSVVWHKPDGWDQVFVIGQNRAIWSRWADELDTSSWASFGGVCLPEHGIEASARGWSYVFNCVGTDGVWWHRSRASDGAWSGWSHGYVRLPNS